MIMADDGKGESVYIPTFLISMYDGMRLKETIHKKDKEDETKHQKVVIQAEIDLISRTKGNLQVDLWYSGAYELMQAGLDLNKYAEMQDIFGERVNF